MARSAWSSIAAIRRSRRTRRRKSGYVNEQFAIDLIEAQGFKLVAKSEINANPKDTKDYEQGVWTLPPVYRLGDKDREKYAAIGESDRFTLKFVKPRARSAARALRPQFSLSSARRGGYHISLRRAPTSTVDCPLRPASPRRRAALEGAAPRSTSALSRS